MKEKVEDIINFNCILYILFLRKRICSRQSRLSGCVRKKSESKKVAKARTPYV